MKHLSIVVIACLLALAGCGGRETTPPAPTEVMASIRDAKTELPVGTVIYSKDGAEAGKIIAYDPAYMFPNKPKEPAVLIEVGKGNQTWWPVTTMQNEYYFKQQPTDKK